MEESNMNRQLLMIGSAKTKNEKIRRPRIRLSGLWLNTIGFIPETLVTVEYARDNIYLRIAGEGIDDYNKVVKDIFRHNNGLLQVRSELKNKKHTPCLEVKGYWLQKLGFSIGSVIVVESGFGYINIQLISTDCVTSKKASSMYLPAQKQ